MKNNRWIQLIVVFLTLFSFIPGFAASIKYIYDDLNRLIRVEGVDHKITEYEYDEIGNRSHINTYDETRTITATAGSGGTISPQGTVQVSFGGSQTFTVTPNTGYRIWSFGSNCGATLSGNTLTAGPITADCTVTVGFTDIHTVTPSAGANGTISPATAQTVHYGSNTSFIVTPNTGYSIGSVTGCGGTLSGNTYLTGQIDADCMVTASFVINSSYTVTPSAGANGTISPATTQIVNYGSSTSFTIIPQASYVVSSVTGCGGSLSGNTYTTGAITENCAVTAAFMAQHKAALLSTDERHSVSTGTDGTLWAWGNNSYGQLGDGTIVQRVSPVQIGTDTNWSAISAGYRHSIALKSDGTLWAWGNNQYGQLGDGTTLQRISPWQIGTGTNWSAVAAGYTHTIALKSDGTLWAWGNNSYGQLGDGTTIRRLSPVQNAVFR